MNLLSIIVPVYNEEGSIGSLIQKLKKLDLSISNFRKVQNKLPFQTSVAVGDNNVYITANVCGAVSTCGPDIAVCAQSNGITVSKTYDSFKL